MEPTLTGDEEGKRIVDADGNAVGTIRKVDQGVAHVDPDDDLATSVRERLDWTDREDYTVQETLVEEIRDDQVVIES